MVVDEVTEVVTYIFLWRETYPFSGNRKISYLLDCKMMMTMIMIFKALFIPLKMVTILLKSVFTFVLVLFHNGMVI